MFLSAILINNIVLSKFLGMCPFMGVSTRLENAIGMERQFVRDISHDLKTPVTVILANNSILRSNPDTKLGDHMQRIDSTDSAARDMMNMVSEMLTLSKLENTEVRAEKECVNLSMEAERTVLQLESVAYENRIELAVCKSTCIVKYNRGYTLLCCTHK